MAQDGGIGRAHVNEHTKSTTMYRIISVEKELKTN